MPLASARASAAAPQQVIGSDKIALCPGAQADWLGLVQWSY